MSNSKYQRHLREEKQYGAGENRAKRIFFKKVSAMIAAVAVIIVVLSHFWPS